MTKPNLSAAARALLERLARTPSTWPDDDAISDLVNHRFVDRRDMAWHVTVAGREYLSQKGHD
ncbi:hypothetical protein [Agrobacterium pusense]|jgi:hypothetical protein|uniref:hypothetical protein n=1 Tax=Agrobacterium pusense TaxID=648995 RepID=UPI0037C09940